MKVFFNQRKIVLVVITFMYFTTLSQTPTDPNMHGWMAKYWFYRWRLQNDFMVMGEGPGKSLVAEIRNPDRFPVIKWSDAMIMHGYYLSMLAIEHKLLSDAGRWEDLKNNERELYFAIKAFERVDYVSETFYSKQGDNFDAYRVDDDRLSADVNGYFFRDDVPPDFLNTTPDQFTNPNYTLNRDHLMSSKTGIDYNLGVNYSCSDYYGLWEHYSNPNFNNSTYLQPALLNKPHNPIVNYNKEDVFGLGQESIDQVIRLLLGFGTIRKSIPSGNYNIDTDLDGTNDVSMNFYSEAGRHATNIIGHMAGWWSSTVTIPQNVTHYSPYPSLQIFGSQFWTIYNPREYPVNIGNVVINFMPPIQSISPVLFSLNNDLNITNPFYAFYSFNASASTIWNAGIGGYNNANIKMNMILKVISKSGYTWSPLPRHIYKKTKEKNFHGFFIPLYDYYWNWNPNKEEDQERKQDSYNFAYELLNAAPCIGPYNFGNISNGVFSTNTEADGIPRYWNAPYIFDNSFETWDDGIQNGGSIQEGWFSGMDYMFLLNLVYANFDGIKPLYHDLINRIVDYPVNANSTSNLYEYSAEGHLIGGFQTLKIRNTIVTNSVPIKCKALEFVQIESGTIDPNNSSITIEVGQITCGLGSTNENTPYKIDECSTCGIEHQIGNIVTPYSNGRSNSLIFTEYEQPINFSLVHNEYSDEDQNDLDLKIYPNPVIDNFEIFSEDSLVELKLYNSNNLLVKTFNPVSTFFSMDDMSTGIYFLSVKNKNNEIHLYKIIKL